MTAVTYEPGQKHFIKRRLQAYGGYSGREPTIFTAWHGICFLRDLAISGREQGTGALSFYTYVAQEGPGRASARMVIWYWVHVRQAIIAFHNSPMYVNSSLDLRRGVNGRNIAPIPLYCYPLNSPCLLWKAMMGAVARSRAL